MMHHLARDSHDLNRPGHLLHRDFALGHAAKQIEDQSGKLFAFCQRTSERLGDRQLLNLHRLRAKTNTIGLGVSVQGGQLRSDRQHLLPPVAKDLQVNWLVLRTLKISLHGACGLNRISIDRGNLVTDLQSCLRAWHVFFQCSYDERLFRKPASVAALLPAISFWQQGDWQNLAAALHLQCKWLVRADQNLVVQILPGRIPRVGYLKNLVPWFQSGLICWISRCAPAHNCRFVEPVGDLMMQSKYCSQQHHGQNAICGRARCSDDQTLPARMLQELAFIVGVSPFGVFFRHLNRVHSGHLHVSAQRQSRDAVVGVATPEAEQTLTEAERENLNTDSQQFGCGKVAELVYQNHYAKHENRTEQSVKSASHKNNMLSPLPECMLRGCYSRTARACDQKTPCQLARFGIHTQNLVYRFRFTCWRFIQNCLNCRGDAHERDLALKERRNCNFVGRVQSHRFGSARLH